MAKEFVKEPFDIEKAKKIYKGELEGRIVTKGGYAVKILCMDAQIVDCPIVALLTANIKQKAVTYTKEGKYRLDGFDCDENLMLELPSSVLSKEEKDGTSTAVPTVSNSIKPVKDKFIKINGLLDNRREGMSKTDEMFINISAIVSVYKDGLKYYIKVSTGELYRICMADYYEVIRIIEGK